MQNKYVGDKGDFGKYLLLKNLCENNNLRLGVNWCLVSDDFEGEDNNDGKFINYLSKNSKSFKYSKVDTGLFEQLQGLVEKNKRKVSEVEKLNILPSDTCFFSEIVPHGTDRFNWHERGLIRLASSDIIFYDPDNGIEVQSCGKLNTKAVKYVFYDEIRDTFKAGKSMIIYQHTNRGKSVEQQIQSRVKELGNCLSIPSETLSEVISVVYSGMGTSRFFLIIKQQKHIEIINQSLLEIGKGRFKGILQIVE